MSTVSKEEMAEITEERELIVHQTGFDTMAAKNIVEKDKTKFFAKLGFFKPRSEDIECDSVQLFYEPFIVAKANYFIDYYRNKTYTIKIRDDVSEVIAFEKTFKPEDIEEGIFRRLGKAIVIDAQERVMHRAAAHMALNRMGREINPRRIPSGPTELDPRRVLEKESERVRDLEISSDTILDEVRKRTAIRPRDVGRITEEKFEVTEYAVVCTPVYEARCRRVKTGEIRILPISGVTGRPLRL